MTWYRALADDFGVLDLGLLEGESAAIASKSTSKEAVCTRGREPVFCLNIALFSSRLVILLGDGRQTREGSPPRDPRVGCLESTRQNEDEGTLRSWNILQAQEMHVALLK